LLVNAVLGRSTNHFLEEKIKGKKAVHHCISEARLKSHAVNNNNNKNDHGNVKTRENDLYL